MKNPVVDVTTLVAIESIFKRGIKDPWSRILAGDFADFFIYNDNIRYILPVPQGTLQKGELSDKPSLLTDLSRRDPKVFEPEIFVTDPPRKLNEIYLKESFNKFANWAKSNRYTLKKWINLHKESWIRQGHRSRIGIDYVFHVQDLKKLSEFNKLTTVLEIDEKSVFYVFDVVMRYPLYGELAGEGVYYLHHPVRDMINIPTMQHSPGKPPQIPLSLKETFSSLVSELSQDEYTSMLHELRGLIRDYGINKVSPGNFDKEIAREIATKLSLPPRIKALGKSAAILAGIIGGISTIPSFGVAGPIAGAIVSVSATLWKGQLPRRISKIKWLRWAYKWDIEDQARKSK